GRVLPRGRGASPAVVAERLRDAGGGRGGSAPLRHPPAAGRGGRLGVRAARRPLGLLLPDRRARLPSDAKRSAGAVARRLARELRPLPLVGGVGDHFARGPACARPLSSSPRPACSRPARAGSVWAHRPRLRRPRLPGTGADRGDAYTRPARGDRARGAGRLRTLVLPRKDARAGGALPALPARAPAGSHAAAVRSRDPRRGG